MVGNPFSEGISVKVGGDARGATRALGNVQRSLISTRKLALGLGGVLAGALAVKGLGSAVKAAASFEDAMVEVQKVTDPETAEELSGRMRDLAKDIPVAANELAGIAADAARFGIRGSENIERFTTTVAKMATATDLSTQEAGEAFARLATLTETPVEEMENLGSSVNELSNTMATSSGEIVDSMLRSSAALNQFGLTNTQIVGFSAALNEVSESSRRAGSRLRRVAQELMDPRKTGDLAEALGMNVEAFEELREEDPEGLMLSMAEAFAEGGDTAEALRGTLSTASRQAVAGLAQNLDGLRAALDRSTRSFDRGESVQKEFDAATQTFNAQLQIFKNNIRDVAITLGNELLPILTPLIQRFSDFIKETSEGTDSFTEFLGRVVKRGVEWVQGDGMEQIKSVVSAITGGLVSLLGGEEDDDLLSAFIDFMEDVLTRVEIWFNTGGQEALTELVTALFGGMNDAITGKEGQVKQGILDPIVSILSSIFDSLTAALSSPEASRLGKSLGNLGGELMRTIADGMIEYAGSEEFKQDMVKLGGAMSNATGSIAKGLAQGVTGVPAERFDPRRAFDPDKEFGLDLQPGRFVGDRLRTVAGRGVVGPTERRAIAAGARGLGTDTRIADDQVVVTIDNSDPLAVAVRDMISVELRGQGNRVFAETGSR